jgi:hypothetical protein
LAQISNNKTPEAEMKELYAEIEINASPEKVWQVLTDFDHFKDWNPFIRSIQGTPQAGSKLNVQIQPPGRRLATFRPRVVKFEPQQEIRWLGHMLVPGLFDDQHTFKVEPLGSNQTRFIHREKFNGVLVPLLTRSLDGETRKGFKEMNEALKKRAEKAS